MTALEIASKIARIFEGLKLKPYLCPAKVPTIGRGATRYENGVKVTLTDPPITEKRADELLDWEMRKSLRGALKYCPILAISDSRLGAITDFCFNLGIGRLQYSTLRRRINEQDWPEVQQELMRWVRGGGIILPGLVLRRKTEAEYFTAKR
jgi:lysozyme